MVRAQADEEMNIFEGQDIRVVARLFDNKTDVLVITFTGRAANPPVEKGFGESYLLKRGISAVHFISKDNHWWQTEEPKLAIEELRRRGLIDGKKQITLYGSSMGGYASLILSGVIRPRRIVVFSPQYSIDEKRVPFERRWRDYAAKLRFDHDDMASGIDHDAETKVVYDPFFLPDRQHVALIEKHRALEHIPVPFAGHNTARVLEELGIITGVIDQLLLGDFQAPEFQRVYRQTRARSSLFWYGLSQTLARHNHHAAAMLASYAAATIMLKSGRMRDTALRRDILRSAIEMACAADMPAFAKGWFANLKEIESSGIRVAYYAALVEKCQGDWSRVDRIIDEALKRGRPEDRHLALKLEAISKLSGPAKAMTYHQTLSASSKRSPPVLRAHAGVRAANKEWSAALELLERFFEHAPRDPASRILGAQCWIAQDRAEAAIRLLSPVLKYHIASDRLIDDAARLLEVGRSLQHAEKLRARHRRYKKFLQMLTTRIEAMEPWTSRDPVGKTSTTTF